MAKTISEIIALSQNCPCGNKHYEIPIDKIEVVNGALGLSVAYMANKSFKKAVLIADEHTFQAAGQELVSLLKAAKIDHSVCLLQPDENKDVVADEASIVQAMIEIPRETDVLLAVGSGTIHDITRFCSYKMEKPFISIPTAPSVDGFNSMGAPLIVRGTKKTFQTISPVAVFADLAILKAAPRKMIAAGFGDMLGKYTSLADWSFGHLIAAELYCPLVADITRDALESCVANVEKIAECDEEGIQILIEALIQSGLAMLLLGHSHPASGSEHHLSHYWEMELLREKRPQILHGAKVGVSSPLIANVYKEELLSLLSDSYKLDISVETLGHKEFARKIIEHKQQVKDIIQSIPVPSYLREMMEKVGGETSLDQLGIDRDLLQRSLREAHLLRDRFTVLKFLNEIVKTEHSIVG